MRHIPLFLPVGVDTPTYARGGSTEIEPTPVEDRDHAEALVSRRRVRGKKRFSRERNRFYACQMGQEQVE